LNYSQSWNQSKVAGVQRRYRITEVQCRAADQQVLERDTYATGSLLSLNLFG